MNLDAGLEEETAWVNSRIEDLEEGMSFQLPLGSHCKFSAYPKAFCCCTGRRGGGGSDRLNIADTA